MADYYWLTITYPDGREIRTPHKGEGIHPAIRRRLGSLGARLELGERVQGGVVAQLTQLEEAELAAGTLGWHPQLPDEGGDDD